ncbi:MAG TPA: FIST N-terminal domain-containing protein [Kineosporiaceae bacterium]|nr:FIST N-terminal domain-containing protein [Kineosporiaceae bacterium]
MRVWTGYIPAAEMGSAGLPADLDSPSTLVLVFSGLPAAEAGNALPVLRRAFPRSVIVGCSTAGEIFGGSVRDGGLCVAVARFERTRLTVARIDLPDAAASRAAGAELARQLQEASLSAVLVYSDGLTVNGSQLMKGLNDGLAEPVVVTGGLAGDGDRFETTWVVVGDKPVSNAVVGVGLHGDAVVIGHGVGGGWDAFGPQRVITRSVGNVMYELDGKLALDLYERYLGDLFAGLPWTGLMFPLTINERPDSDSFIRAVLSVDRDAHTMTFAGDVPEGWTAQLTRPNPVRVVEGATQAAEACAVRSPVAGECLAVAASCCARRLVLKERTEEELEVVTQGLPPGAQLVGFYSYGEITPLPSGRSDLHNQTMTLTLLAERPA